MFNYEVLCSRLDLDRSHLRGRRLPRPHDVTEALEEEFHGLGDLGGLLLEYHGTVLVLHGWVLKSSFLR